MKVIGITGGIGSGKSLVAKIVHTLGFPVYYSDQRAKELMDENPAIQIALLALFGQHAYSQGKLNKSFIADQIFQDDDKRLKMNQIVHPVVRADFMDWVKSQNTPLVFQESALLFETGNHAAFDAIILVTASESLRIQRVMERDGLTEEQVKARISAQLSDEQKRKKTPYIVRNDGDEFLIPQILEILSTLKKLT